MTDTATSDDVEAASAFLQYARQDAAETLRQIETAIRYTPGGTLRREYLTRARRALIEAQKHLDTAL